MSAVPNPVQTCAGHWLYQVHRTLFGIVKVLLVLRLHPNFLRQVATQALAVSALLPASESLDASEAPAAPSLFRKACDELGTGALVKKVAETLRIPPSEVDPSRAMYHYGVDSLVATSTAKVSIGTAARISNNATFAFISRVIQFLSSSAASCGEE
jgi:hypothetical protein